MKRIFVQAWLTVLTVALILLIVSCNVHMALAALHGISVLSK